LEDGPASERSDLISAPASVQELGSDSKQNSVVINEDQASKLDFNY